jgi:hypothetical protein
MWQQRHPRLMVGGRCCPPRPADHRTSPLPSFSRLHADAPMPTPNLSSLPRATEPLFKSVDRRPYCPPFRALCPSSSTVTLPAHAAGSRGLSRAPDAAPLRQFGSHHCRDLGLTVSSASPVFSAQISSAPHFPSDYRCSKHRPPPPSTTVAHCRPLKRHCPSLPPPPIHRAAASVRPRWYHLARRFPLFTLELPPPVSPHLVTRLDVGSRATAGVPCAVTTRCAHRATSIGRLGLPFGLGPPCGAGRHAH